MRPRAPKACQACRSRKVKCDVSSSGIPCGNCSRKQDQCLISQARKRRTIQSTSDPRAPPTGIHTFEVNANGMPGPGHVSYRSPNRRPTPEATARLVAELRSYRESAPQAAANLATPSSLGEGSQSAFPLPSFISPLCQSLDPEVVHFLHRRKALSLPCQAVRKALLRAYVLYVHPLLPLLDLEELLQAIDGNDRSKKISLILFQAIMFAATSFVEIDHLQVEGFADRKQARKDYFGRVRGIFDADLERDPIPLIQSLILMTYLYDRLDDLKGPYHWMRIAWSFVIDRGINCPAILAQLPIQQQKLQRRLWWCCFMRDQLLSISERRPTCISTNESDYPPLLADDFESSTFPETLQNFFPSDIMQPKLLSSFCIHKIKLCIQIRHILRTQYEVGARRVTSTEPGVWLVPKTSRLASAELVNCDCELRKWNCDFTSIMQSFTRENPNWKCDIVTVHWALLEILYQTVTGTAHRPQLLMRHPEDSAAKVLLEFSQNISREAARKITEVSKTLQEADLLRFQPPVIVTALLGSVMQHLKDRSSNNVSVRSAAQSHLNHTSRSLFRLQEIWYSADNVVSFLETFRTRRSTDTIVETTQNREQTNPHNISSDESSDQEQTPRNNVDLDFENWPRNTFGQSGPQTEDQGDNFYGAISTEVPELVHSRDGQGLDIDDEWLFNFNSSSEELFWEIFDPAELNAGN